MANLSEQSIWETGVYQIEENDPVHGGANGVTNRPTKQLANRTVWLKNELASSVQAINANLTSLSTNKADKTLNLVAGNGLTGGGTLQANRTLTLGTPSQITASSTNAVTATSHTHAIDKASTTTQGIVQLNDTLVSTATDQALTAKQGKVLNDKITATDAKADTKANQATTITAGNGLTGGGTLQANRTLTLGTPSQITASSTNAVTATSHTHAIDKASTTTQGIVQLNDTLVSTATDQALTANQGKVLNDKIDNKDSLKTIDYFSDQSSNYQLTGFYRSNSKPLDGINTSPLEIHITHPTFPGNAYARGIGFEYGSSFDLYSHAWSPQGVHLGRKKILTEENGVQKSGDAMTGYLTLSNQPWPKVQLASSSGNQALLLESGGTEGTHCLIIRRHENGTVINGNIARFNLPTVTGTKTFAVEDGNVASATKLQTARTINGVAFDGTQNITIYDNTKLASNGNAVSASRLATARTISLTGAVTGSVSFNGSANVSIATTLSKAVVREYNSSFISSIGVTNYTIPISGQVVTGADGRITQYIHLQHFRDIWFAMNENSVGNYSGEATRSRLLQIPLWTAMPNKVLSVSAQAMRSTNTAQSAAFFGEAGEHQVAWAKRQQGINKTHAFVEMARIIGGVSEEIDMFVIVEGY